MNAPVIEMKQLMGNAVMVTIHVKGLREVRFRFWLGILLLKLAAWILPTRVYIECDRDITL